MECQGRGERVLEVCVPCSGTGYLPDKRTLTVNIAPGTKADEIIVFSEVCSDHVDFERPGDVHIQIVEDKSDTAYAVYRRSGPRMENLEMTVELCLSESLLGCVVKLEDHPGYDEALYVHVPPGSFQGDTVFLQGFGMPIPGAIGQHGDLLIRVEMRAKVWERSLFVEHAEEALGQWFRDKVRAPPAAGENVFVARFHTGSA
jgi:DnaJ-class molecular chaperone